MKRLFWLCLLLISAGCSLRRQSVENNWKEKPARPECFSKRSEKNVSNGCGLKNKKNFQEVVNEQDSSTSPHPFDTKLLRNFTQGERARQNFIDDSQEHIKPPVEKSQRPEEVKHKASKKKSHNYGPRAVEKLDSKMLVIDFENEDLAVLINHFAALQKKNIVLPQGAHAINQKITFKLNQEIPLREVNKYLDMFLDLAGYSRVPHGDVERIIPNDNAVVHEPLPLYVETDPKDLPNSDERIRLIYYFKNLHVSADPGSDVITSVLSSVLSAHHTITYSPESNAVIVADKANNIRAAMSLLVELDSFGSRQIIRAMSLYNSTATVVAELVTKQIMAAAGDEQAGIITDSSQYFSSGLRIVPDIRTNSLVIMGREPAVERLQDFIREYIDVPGDMGSSVLHFYDLQYLEAEKFAPVLQAVVKEQNLLSSGQAAQQAGDNTVRHFQNVVVVAEKFLAERVEAGRIKIEAEAGSAVISEQVLKGSVYRGGNRIIVTALRDDWKRIEKLIKQLDQPKLQVLVQILIVDLDTTNFKTLASQLRNPSWMQLPPGMAFQSAQLVNPILDGPIESSPPAPTPPPYTYTDPTTVAADLLRLLSGGVSAATQIVNQTGNAGSTIISFNDPSATTPGIWMFMQWLSKIFATKIVQHPYLVVQNYEKGEEYISDIRRVNGMSSVGEGGSVAISLEDVPAAVEVVVQPRASSLDRLNLKVALKIDHFEGNNANRITRTIETSVNLGSGDVLVLGGLTRSEEDLNESKTPILGDIPLIKWLFSNTSRNIRHTNLVAFISPTIFEPRMPEGMDAFTKTETHRNYKLMKQDELLSQLKEPISCLFFDERNDNLGTMLDQYMSVGKGDFIFSDPSTPQGTASMCDKATPGWRVGEVPGYSNHKCDPCNDSISDKINGPAFLSSHVCNPCKNSIEDDINTCDASARIKRQFSCEEKVLTVSHETPEMSFSNDKKTNLYDYFDE